VQGYVLQNKDIAPAFFQSFSKIRKDHTAFVMYESEMGKFHTGIFLDIFPLDRIPDGKLSRMVFKWHCMVYQLMVKGFAPPLSAAPVRFGSNVILALIPKSRRDAVRRKMLRKITRYNENRELETVGIETMGALRKPFAADMLDAYTYLPFEDGEFMCFADWEDHLRRKFGDYMQLPPEEERAWRHHPIVLDFAHNYEELARK
jgi:lipopolysaccharide cholinephosphotransferase